jgi:hypothetical protein
MQQSPSWKVNIHSASQKIPRLFWNPKFHYRVLSATGSYPEPDGGNTWAKNKLYYELNEMLQEWKFCGTSQIWR